jgi:very-short-patch-repair endonuclease
MVVYKIMSKPNSNNNYNKDLKEYARELRNNSTFAEVILWNDLLKKKQLRGYSFLRQRPIQNYIVNFFCKDLKLIIEIDGRIHQYQKKCDDKRDADLKNLGYSVIRFHNKEVLANLYNVQKTLEYFIDDFELRKETYTKITP